MNKVAILVLVKGCSSQTHFVTLALCFKLCTPLSLTMPMYVHGIFPLHMPTPSKQDNIPKRAIGNFLESYSYIVFMEGEVRPSCASQSS